MNASGRYSDATPLSAAALGAATELFLDHAWRRFLTVVDHARRCSTGAGPRAVRGPTTPQPCPVWPTP
ncbi:hypothetical protein [Streptomyces sp. Root369]|uniref:hypothetical protein n=1 Tax=Streptomyces sp. Root369 TaxID=1736523 RepID=UPI000AC3C385|nr:hypothetical protein [Streptomyces sp. Root369]